MAREPKRSVFRAAFHFLVYNYADYERIKSQNMLHIGYLLFVHLFK